MMTLYKLTNRDGYSRCGESNELKWREGCTHTATGVGAELCTDKVIHTYEHPLVGIFMNPIHANFDPETMRLWRCEGRVVAREGQLKCGTKSLTVVEEIRPPTLTTEQRIAIAILCAKQVCSIPQWVAWADRWLNKKDRTAAAAREAAWTARAAAEEAEAAAWEAWWEAAAEAARAARAAARAAWMVARAAWEAAAWAAEVAGEAAWVVEWTARAAAKIDLISIIESVCPTPGGVPIALQCQCPTISNSLIRLQHIEPTTQLKNRF